MEKQTEQATEFKSELIVSTIDLEVSTFSGASMLVLTEAETKALRAPISRDLFEIRPDGMVYLPQVHKREKLNDVFGFGQWTVIPKDIKKEEQGQYKIRIFYTGCLYIRGHFISVATGEQVYNPTNANQSFATATEGAKSDCIGRCCKDLGIAKEEAQPHFLRAWQKEFAVKVFVEKEDSNGKSKKEVAWRRRDVDPFWNETGLVPTKPVVPETPQVKKNTGAITHEWTNKLKSVQNRRELTAMYSSNQQLVDAWPELKDAFVKRQNELPDLKKVA